MSWNPRQKPSGSPPVQQPAYAPSPPAYPAVPAGYGYPQPARTNGRATAALVLGILGLIPVMTFGIGSVLGLIFGIVSRNQIRRSQGTQTGEGFALTGIILGTIGIVLAVALLAILVVGMGAAYNTG